MYMIEWCASRLSMGKPKIHALEGHLLATMRFFRGLLEYSEDVIELSHQLRRLKSERKQVCMRSREKLQIAFAESVGRDEI
jgi:hypothetical protein